MEEIGFSFLLLQPLLPRPHLSLGEGDSNGLHGAQEIGLLLEFSRCFPALPGCFRINCGLQEGSKLLFPPSGCAVIEELKKGVRAKQIQVACKGMFLVCKFNSRIQVAQLPFLTRLFLVFELLQGQVNAFLIFEVVEAIDESNKEEKTNEARKGPCPVLGEGQNHRCPQGKKGKNTKDALLSHASLVCLLLEFQLLWRKIKWIHTLQR